MCVHAQVFLGHVVPLKQKYMACVSVCVCVPVVVGVGRGSTGIMSDFRHPATSDFD